VKRTLRDSKQNTSFKEVRFMSMVKEALRTEETRTNEGRTVAGIVNSIETLEGGGFLVRRPFPKASFSDFDPFLLLDEMGPMDVAPGEAKGAPDHPHRGFETVTYLLSGDMQHKDSGGHAGRLAALPIPSSRIPKATSGDGLVSVSVIAGEAMGEKAVIETRTPIIYLHYRLEPGGVATQQVPHDYNAFAYVVDGAGLFGAEGERGSDGQMVMFAPDGDEVRIESPADAKATLEVLVIAGAPLNEPIARYGPFVMNTEAEIHQAFEDYRRGRMGAINS
jgi:redox-sensitive bicupin YhaK (pirin superfamily)